MSNHHALIKILANEKDAPSQMFEQRLNEAIDAEILDQIDPDYMLYYGQNTHSFFWSTISGLLIDQIADEDHARWMIRDRKVEQIYDKIMNDDGYSKKAVIGRFGNLQNEPVVTLWHETPHVMTCLRELIPHVGPSFTVVIEAFHSGRKVFQFPPPQHNTSRTHKYWQTRQTSESKNGRHR